MTEEETALGLLVAKLENEFEVEHDQTAYVQMGGVKWVHEEILVRAPTIYDAVAAMLNQIETRICRYKHRSGTIVWRTKPEHAYVDGICKVYCRFHFRPDFVEFA